MANSVLLNKKDHSNLKVKTEHTAELGDAVMSCITFADEFRNVQGYYPIVFQKYPDSNRYASLALFGLEDSENVFLTDDGRWDAGYIPLMQRRIPFSVGLYKNTEGDEGSRRMLHVDLDHPRVNDSVGEALFDEQGQETPYLQKMSGMLETIHHWASRADMFNEALAELDLLEPITLDVTAASGQQGQLVGFYTINEEALAGLEMEHLHGLQKNGFLEPIYMVLASMTKIRELAKRK